MILAQFEWTRVAEVGTVLFPSVAVPLTLMVFYLRSLHEDLRRSIAGVHQRIDKIDERLVTVETRKVDRRDFVLKAARTNGKIEQLWNRMGEVKDLVHEMRGRLDGEVGVGRQVNELGNKVVEAIREGAKR